MLNKKNWIYTRGKYSNLDSQKKSSTKLKRCLPSIMSSPQSDRITVNFLALRHSFVAWNIWIYKVKNIVSKCYGRDKFKWLKYNSNLLGYLVPHLILLFDESDTCLCPATSFPTDTKSKTIMCHIKINIYSPFPFYYIPRL